MSTVLAAAVGRAPAVPCTTSPSCFFAPDHFERKPEKDQREAAARALCDDCPVQQACIEFSVDEPHGIWGGLNELQRSWRRRKLAAVAGA